METPDELCCRVEYFTWKQRKLSFGEEGSIFLVNAT